MPTAACQTDTRTSKTPLSRHVYFIGIVLALLSIGLVPASGADELPAEFIAENLLPENGGTGSDGLFIQGDDTCNYFGKSLASAGDFNADGIDDFIVGARQLNCASTDGIGKAYVIYGTTNGFPPSFNARELHPENGGDGSAGVVLRGIVRRGEAGNSVAGIGDFNDDGIDDVAIGAPGVPYQFTGYAGATYVVFGSATNMGAQVEISSFLEENGGDGTKGFVVYGTNGGAVHPLGDQSGQTVRKAGDVNNDGIPDLLVSAPTAELVVDGVTLENPGQAYLLFGSAAPFPPSFLWSDLEPENGGDGSIGVTFNGSASSQRLGTGLDGIGDFNGDGIDDFALGATSVNSAADNSMSGAAYIFYGKSNPWPPVIEPYSMFPSNGGDGSLGLVIEAGEGITGLGQSIAGIGDFNNDGFDDLAVHSWRDTFEPVSPQYDGVAYVIFGESQAESPVFTVSDLLEVNGGNGEEGFAIHRNGNRKKFGASMDGGDINNDGFSDLMLGAESDTTLRTGEAYVLYGNDNNIAEFYTSSLTVENGAQGQSGLLIRSNLLGMYGHSVAMIGDINHDGFIDFATGNLLNPEPELHWVGSAAIFYGKPRPEIIPDLDFDGVADAEDNCLLLANPEQDDTDGDGFGNRCDGDFNNDCVVNFIDYNQITQQFLMPSELLDLNSDGVVSFIDISLFAYLFLQPIGPSGTTGSCE